MLEKIKNIKFINSIYKGDSLFFQSYLYTLYGSIKLIQWLNLYRKN